MQSKLIKLEAFGGYLEGPLVEVPSDIKEYFVPYIKEEFTSYRLDLLEQPIISYNARFISIDKYVTLENYRTAEIFELVSM